MLLKKANTITTPTAYSNGFLHSVKPEVVENLLLQSNQFDTTWLNQLGGTITSGQSGYDGSSDAWLISKDTSTFRSVRQVVSWSGVSTFSVYAKSGSLSNAALRVDTGAGAIQILYDLTDGSVTSTSGAYIGAGSDNIGGGWYRLYVSANVSSGTNVHIYADRDGTTAGNIYIQDAQLNKGATAYPYLETTTEAKPSADFTFTRNSSATRVNELGYIEDVTSDTPRINYEGFTYENGLPVPYSGKGHLLLEPQRSNLIPYSEDISQFELLQTAVISSQVISPDGTQNADLLVATAVSDFHYCREVLTVTSGVQYTFSFFAKKKDYDYVQFSRTVDGGSYANFNIANGTLGNNSGADILNHQIEDYGSGWYRCIVSFSTSTTSSGFGIALIESDVSSRFEAFLGNGLSGTYIWGAQVEQGSYSTSLINTSGTAVTRLGETCNNATHSFPSEGVLYAEARKLNNDSRRSRISLSDGTSNNRIIIDFSNVDNQLEYYLISGGTTYAATAYSLNLLEYNKIAIRFKANDVSLWVNGSQVQTDTNATMPIGLNVLTFDAGNGADDFYGKTKMVATFPYLSNDEMECLTT